MRHITLKVRDETGNKIEQKYNLHNLAFFTTYETEWTTLGGWLTLMVPLGAGGCVTILLWHQQQLSLISLLGVLIGTFILIACVMAVTAGRTQSYLGMISTVLNLRKVGGFDDVETIERKARSAGGITSVEGEAEGLLYIQQYRHHIKEANIERADEPTRMAWGVREALSIFGLGLGPAVAAIYGQTIVTFVPSLQGDFLLLFSSGVGLMLGIAYLSNPSLRGITLRTPNRERHTIVLNESDAQALHNDLFADENTRPTRY